MPHLALINELIGLPELASEHGEMVDHMLEIVHWVMGILFVGWSIFLCIVLWKFRQSKNPRASYSGVTNHASSHIEAAVIIVEAILLLGFAIPLWKTRVEEFPDGPGVVKVRAVGEKFKWTFQYPGADGILGTSNPRLITTENPLGLNKDDPNGKDDFLVSNELRIPLNQKVIIDVASRDVIHNLALTPMRIAQDAIPGTPAQMWFTPVKKGEWEIICGQLCGAGHANMVARLYVDSPADWQAFCDEYAPTPAPAAAEASPEDEESVEVASAQ